MNTIKNLLNLSIGELMHEFYKLGDNVYFMPLADTDNHIRLNSNGYDRILLSTIFDDICRVLEFNYNIYWNGQEYPISNFCYYIAREYDIEKLPHEEKEFFKEIREASDDYIRLMEFVMNNTQPGKLDNLHIKNSAGAYLTASYGSSVYSIYYDKYGEAIDNPSNTNDRRERNLRQYKRPNNTLKQQIALLEYTGIIDHLIGKYEKNDSKLSEILSNILNRDKQNIRELLSFSKTKDKQSNIPDNMEFIKNLFEKITPEDKKE